jgi:hypothetical protein
MTVADWVMLVLSQLGLIIILLIEVAFAWDDHTVPGWPFVSALVALDVLVLVGVIGPGLPLSAQTGTELLVADLGAFAIIFIWEFWFYERNVKVFVRFTGGLLLAVLVEGLLLTGVIWPNYHPTARSPTPTVTVTITAPAAAPSGQSTSGSVAVAIAAVGAGGALLGGLGTLLAGWGTFSKHRNRNKNPKNPAL